MWSITHCNFSVTSCALQCRGCPCHAVAVSACNTAWSSAVNVPRAGRQSLRHGHTSGRCSAQPYLNRMPTTHEMNTKTTVCQLDPVAGMVSLKQPLSEAPDSLCRRLRYAGKCSQFRDTSFRPSLPCPPSVPFSQSVVMFWHVKTARNSYIVRPLVRLT